MTSSDIPAVDPGDRRRLASTFGLPEPSGDGPTLREIRDAVRAETDPEFASMGEAIRDDLSDDLDCDLVDEALAGMEARIERLPEIRETGVPDGEDGPDELYRELLPPAWTVYRHLVEVGFFESAEEHLPAFTPEYIERTAREYVRAEPVTAALSHYGFSEHERTALLLNVVDNDTRLSRWVPTNEIPDGVEFTVEYVPPLHQRATGGALLWINALDRHLWQKEILVTERILDDAFWHAKAMLAGLYVTVRAARAIAAGDDAELDDAETAAALAAGAAIAIVNQEELMRTAFWITEEKRAPSEAW